MNDGWEVASPDTVGFVPATLCGIGPRLTAWTEADIHSVLVMRHGKLVYGHISPARISDTVVRLVSSNSMPGRKTIFARLPRA